MIIDAIVLAGGQATRLGGTSKPALAVDGRSLLELTLSALSVVRDTVVRDTVVRDRVVRDTVVRDTVVRHTVVRHIVVVGDEPDIRAAAPDATITIVREFPPFAGPAAAIAAGLGALDDDSDFVVVLGCDMPAVGDAIDVLLGAVQPGSDGAAAVSSDGRPQSLVAVYSTPALADCVRHHRDTGDLENLSVRALLSGLEPALVPVPDGSTDDVDTWDDAARLGVLIPQLHPTKD